MATYNIESVVELFALADKVAREVEAQELVTLALAARSEKPTGNPKESGDKKNKRKAVAAFGLGGQGRPPPYPTKPVDKKQQEQSKNAKKWCEIHKTDCHDLTECRLVKNLAENQQRDHEERRKGDNNNEAPGDRGLSFQEPRQAVAMISGGANTPPSRRKAKLPWREVCATVPPLEASQLLRWFGMPLTFDRNDHPDNTAGLGELPMVVTPTICNLAVARVLSTAEVVQDATHLRPQ